MDNLKPCPFCGGEANFEQYPDAPEYFAIVRCSKCDIRAVKDKDEEAIEAWNTRAHKPFILTNGVAFCCECGTCIGRHDDHYSECSSCGAKVVD